MKQREILEMKNALLAKKEILEERVEKIHSSKNRDEPLSADSGEQSLELENDEVVDALDEMEMNDLRQINVALERIDKGGYGICASCGEDIGMSRLKALPFTPVCVECASESSQAMQQRA